MFFLLCRWVARQDEIVYFPTVKMKRKLPITVTSINTTPWVLLGLYRKSNILKEYLSCIVKKKKKSQKIKIKDKVQAADLISYTTNYNYTLYFFIECKFCQIHRWITFFFLICFSMPTELPNDQRSITIDQVVNNIRLIRNLICMLNI